MYCLPPEVIKSSNVSHTLLFASAVCCFAAISVFPKIFSLLIVTNRRIPESISQSLFTSDSMFLIALIFWCIIGFKNTKHLWHRLFINLTRAQSSSEEVLLHCCRSVMVSCCSVEPHLMTLHVALTPTHPSLWNSGRTKSTPARADVFFWLH